MRLGLAVTTAATLVLTATTVPVATAATPAPDRAPAPAPAVTRDDDDLADTGLDEFATEATAAAAVVLVAVGAFVLRRRKP